MKKLICSIFGHKWNYEETWVKPWEPGKTFILCSRCGAERCEKDLRYWNMVDYWKTL